MTYGLNSLQGKVSAPHHASATVVALYCLQVLLGSSHLLGLETLLRRDLDLKWTQFLFHFPTDTFEAFFFFFALVQQNEDQRMSLCFMCIFIFLVNDGKCNLPSMSVYKQA